MIIPVMIASMIATTIFMPRKEGEPDRIWDVGGLSRYSGNKNDDDHGKIATEQPRKGCNCPAGKGFRKDLF